MIQAALPEGHLDTLSDFQDTGFAALSDNSRRTSNAVVSEIDNCRAYAAQKPNFKDGLTILVGCGVGRAAYYLLSESMHSDWNAVFLSASDTTTLSSLGDIKVETLWRIVDAQAQLSRHGVKVVNPNGLPNLIAWIRSLDGHLVPHSKVPMEWGAGHSCSMFIDTAMVRQLRRESTTSVDRHSEQNVSEEWTVVRKSGDSYFEEDRSLPLYATDTIDSSGGIPLVFLTPTRRWWCEVRPLRNYDRWKLMKTWFPKVAARLDTALRALPPGPLLLRVTFGACEKPPDRAEQLAREQIVRQTKVHVDVPSRLVTIETDVAFEHGLANPVNISERALVEAIVSGFMKLAGAYHARRACSLTENIVESDHARDLHIFHAKQFRDFVREHVLDKPVRINTLDDATIRLGLGWRVRQREEGASIEGKPACTEFLNSLVTFVENDLCSDLKGIDREALIGLALENHEAAMLDRDRWRRTAGAILALHSDKASAMAVISEHDFKNSAAAQLSRILVELAVCECPTHGGKLPGRLDLARLLAKLNLVDGYGGWSDAIHRDAMPPSIRIMPLGDVHADLTFFHSVVQPFGYASSGKMVESLIGDYPKHFQPPKSIGAVEAAFEADFTSAWKDECRFGLDNVREFLDEIEDIGIKQGSVVLSLRRDELHAQLTTIPNSREIAASLTIKPRSNWRQVPHGYSDKDRQPWRLRRRLSLLRLPIVQVTDDENPLLMMAPGLVRDAVMYTVRCYYEGSLPLEQLRTGSMKSWRGRVTDARGKEFNTVVAERLREFGWNTEVEVAVTKILRMGFKVNYGDVDVIAWHKASCRVLCIECKDLHFHKTPGELAEQLNDFRGVMRKEKPDLLKKHLIRCEILKAHADRVKSYLKVSTRPTLESWVIFRNPVPMLFAWSELENQVKIATYDDLGKI